MTQRIDKDSVQIKSQRRRSWRPLICAKTLHFCGKTIMQIKGEPMQINGQHLCFFLKKWCRFKGQQISEKWSPLICAMCFFLRNRALRPKNAQINAQHTQIEGHHFGWNWKTFGWNWKISFGTKNSKKCWPLIYLKRLFLQMRAFSKKSRSKVNIGSSKVTTFRFFSKSFGTINSRKNS